MNEAINISNVYTELYNAARTLGEDVSSDAFRARWMKTEDVMRNTTPEALATYEWEKEPTRRKGFTSKQNYVNVRKMELQGRLHVG